METFYSWLNSLLNKNKLEFAQWPDIRWSNPYIAHDYQYARDQLLSKIGDSVLYKATKPYHKQISPGCKICAAGKWSCLFITNKCNASCFYCPAPQKKDELPSTQGLDFNNAREYAEYIHYFGFEGVSFSGGEPLLYFDRTMNYLKQVRQINNNAHIWMYTNGILADIDKLQNLATAGLNEIRFDIGATGFDLTQLKHAKGLIPHITVEIPAIPEEKNRLIKLLPQMQKAGVTNLNLHQLRLTTHNARHLLKRDYTIVNAERPLVLESELAALEIIQAAHEMDLDMGINYCSFHFKNRFQKAGFRNQIARTIYPGATITPNGYIREFSGDSIRYKMVRLLGSNNDHQKMQALKIHNSTLYYLDIQAFQKDKLPADERLAIQNLLDKEPVTIPNDPLLFKIWQMEYIEHGLRDY
jgi:pyruvate formate-lyase activating enzyme-like uncharacterized protein